MAENITQVRVSLPVVAISVQKRVRSTVSSGAARHMARLKTNQRADKHGVSLYGVFSPCLRDLSPKSSS